MNQYEYVLSNKDLNSPIKELTVVVEAESDKIAQVIIDREYPEHKWCQIDSGLIPIDEIQEYNPKE